MFPDHVAVDFRSPRKPYVVTVEKREIFAFRISYSKIASCPGSSIRLLINTYVLSQRLKIIYRSVGRTVIDHNDFEFLAPLRKNGLQCAGQKVSPIERGNNYGKKWHRSSRFSSVQSSIFENTTTEKLRARAGDAMTSA